MQCLKEYLWHAGRELYERFYDGFAGHGEPNIPFDKAFLQSDPFYALLARLKQHVEEHQRDHWSAFVATLSCMHRLYRRTFWVLKEHCKSVAPARKAIMFTQITLVVQAHGLKMWMIGCGARAGCSAASAASGAL